MINFKNISLRLPYVLVLFTVIAITHCAPLTTDDEATIQSYKYTNDGNGNDDYRFKTSNGTTRQETGTLVDVGLPNEHIVVKGSYSYNDSEGKLVTMTNVADEKGHNIIPDVPRKEPPKSFTADSYDQLLRRLGTIDSRRIPPEVVAALYFG